MAKFNSNELKRKMIEAQRKAEQQVKREVDRANRANKKIVDDHNRKIDAYNRKAISDHNRSVRQNNQKAEAHNRKVLAELNRQLRTASSPVRYSDSERQLADKVHETVASLDPREYDSFLSYARIDGAEVASRLRDELENLGVAVWFDEVAIIPGRSQSLQMDAGLRKARSGITVLTPAYLTGRFWTERELGALLNKNTLIPVLHNVTFDDVKQYSGILPDLAGFTTQYDSVEDIAKKIAAAVIVDDVG
ncbi:TIR domain-containing protein [Vreelandella sedimenti]|uniref:TIR domain-containing protein n=1 Tax=Vreelandella sedimenti TaxID=2729618 RepID=UPI00257BC43A|nr:TIR domain-containing protein [Halomonas sp. UBA3173]|tara:strand:+ start:14115 stop:14861 length:747 start_codon:yes stop_codon:yes gene_type:complete